MNFKENESVEKLRGGYYTPPDVAKFLTRWAIKKKPVSLLEPSSGDGAFIRALEGLNYSSITVMAIERLTEEATKSRNAANALKNLKSKVLCTDFLEWVQPRLDACDTFDAITGNPPYIRYQYLDKKDQDLSEKTFRRYKLPFTKHTNAWVPFIISCIGLLSPGGRLAMVIPAEVLHVLHAGSLRKFLLDKSSKIFMIDPNELLFSEALQGTVLLMVEKKVDENRPSEGVSILAAPDNRFLQNDPETLFKQASFVRGDVLNGKWMKVLMQPEELAVFEKVRKLPNVKIFKDVAEVDVGIVTGANKFFLISDETVKAHGLEKFVRPMFGRSEHCPGVIYDEAVHALNRANGLPTNFLMLGDSPLESLPATVRGYIQIGVDQKLPQRYKCSIRKPWYNVPSVYATPLGMLKRSHNYPRLILNAAGAFTTDTAYRIRSLGPKPDKLVYCFINSLTALTAELEGRHYGGGVLELVPSEIEKLLIPLPSKLSPRLKALDKLIRGGAEPEAILLAQDNHILHGAGLTEDECNLLRQSLLRIRSRRHRVLTEQGEESE